MRALKWSAILAVTLSLFALGCTTKPIFNVSAAPVQTVKPNPSLAEVEGAIRRAGAGLGWQMLPTKPGHILATLYLRTHVAKVDVNYTATTYSIMYNDSTNLEYDGQNIHNNYNGWILNLNNAIRAQLSSI